MTELIEPVQLLRDSQGQPTFAVIPYSTYLTYIQTAPVKSPNIPNTVVNLAMDNDWSAAQAWRSYLGLTQSEMAGRLNVSQSAYAQLEGKKTIRKSSREKIAQALRIHPEQLDF